MIFHYKGEINAYQKIVEEMQESQEFTPLPQPKKPDVPSGKVYKEKSLADLVRLQRPEITRKKPASRIPVSEAMMQEIKEQAAADTDRRDSGRELSVQDRQRLYGQY